MSTPFLAEIRIVAFNFAPRGFAQCNGNLLAISQNQALFSILGTTYGGDGVRTFGLPDFRGRVPFHASSQGFVLGQQAGEEGHTLAVPEMPQHTHSAFASSNAPSVAAAAGNFWATGQMYSTPPANSSMSTNAIGSTGSNQSHENRSPFLTLNFVIALTGIFPSRN